MRDIFEKEYALQLKIYGNDWPDDIDACIEEYSKHLHIETVEMLQETNFRHKKSWRGTNLAKLQFEVVDVFLTALAAATISFASYEDFVLAIQKKMNHNHTRKDWEVNNQ